MGEEREIRDGYVLEVIACTVEDAVEAELGGADRLELVSRLDLGGLTPSFDLVRHIKSTVSLPLRVMLRSSEGYEVPGETEYQSLCAAAAEFERIGVDGIVLGFLNGPEVDLESTRRILRFAPNLRATFHHAFEDSQDKFSTIKQLKRLSQIDRILSHGGHDNPDVRSGRLESYRNTSKPEIEILAGGGVDVEAIRAFKKLTSLREFHVGSAARVDGKVDRLRVNDLVAALKVNYG
jgi:copper homeostasis protein